MHAWFLLKELSGTKLLFEIPKRKTGLRRNADTGPLLVFTYSR